MSNNKHTFYTLVVYAALVLAAWCIAAGISQMVNNLTQ